jgi:adenosine kinase
MLRPYLPLTVEQLRVKLHTFFGENMNIVITGSVAFDYLMQFPGYFRDHFLPDKLDHISLSFLVESMSRWRGGVAPNIAYTLALLGERPRLMATVGEDFGEYRTWLEERGIDTSAVKIIPREFTASFFCNTDRSNAQIASFYPGAMARSNEVSFYELPYRPDLAVISPSDPSAMTGYTVECRALGIPYLYDPSQQLARLTAEDVKSGIEGALALMVNDYEFGMVQKMTGMTQADILAKVKFMAVTRGEQGATVYAEGEEYHIPVVPPACICDPTGVGDAFRGGFLTGLAHGWSWDLCGQMGALAATYCLEQTGPQGHAYTPKEFVARFREHFDDHGILDQIGEKHG